MAVVAFIFGEVFVFGFHASAEGVMEFGARPPDETEAEFPSGLGDFVEFFLSDLDVIVEEAGEGDGRAFAYADDADVFRADDQDIERGDFGFEGDGGHKAGAATAQNDYLVNRH